MPSDLEVAMTATVSPPGSATASSRPAPRAPSRVRSSAPSTGRLPGLDGLRTVAIVAVLIFHLNAAWLPGGFIGVDIFFVVSGFLITTLLVRERASTGRVDLAGFWGRRARRLLPALLLAIPVSVLLARLTEADLLVGVGSQVLGALTFAFNWVQIAAGADYFHATTPQLFMNYWSLAVEEQFYLIWPLATLVLLRLVRSGRARAGIAGGLAVLSAVLMALRFDPDAGATRVYYGTDTHVFGLMIGAALAFWYADGGAARLAAPAWVARRRPVAGIAGAVLLGSMWWLEESRALTFRGGLAIASLATAALIAVAVGGGTVARLLDLPPMRWIGERSYGIYLWHWPVILVVNADITSVPGSAGFLSSRLWAVLVTFAIADLSYRLVERPVRRFGWRGAFTRLAACVPGRADGARVLAGAITVLVVATVAVIATAPDATSTEKLIAANAKAAERTATSTATAPALTTATFTMPKGNQIDAYGDSMMIGSVPALKYYFPGIRIDAKSNRRWSAGLAAVTASGTDIRRAVVLSFGTNAGVDEADVRATLDKLGPKRMVVLVNIHLNEARATADNTTLAKVAADYPNAIVADWNAEVTKQRGLLQPDGIHPSMTGQHRYAALVRQALADLSYQHTGKVVKLKPLPIP
ncbi:acyltransferase family protein [Nostocoides australiense]|nr:acyltransferase family protein [Tetrasphaera australiensis]